MDEDQIEALLNQWEQTYKRGLLSFWILLSLNEREMYAYEMRDEIRQLSQGSIIADDNSIYRALKRFTQTGLVLSNKRASAKGPPRRYFALTTTGQELLAVFIRRNILVFQETVVAKAIEKVIAA